MKNIDEVLEAKTEQIKSEPWFINQAMLVYEIEQADREEKEHQDEVIADLYRGETIFGPFRRPRD